MHPHGPRAGLYVRPGSGKLVAAGGPGPRPSIRVLRSNRFSALRPILTDSVLRLVIPALQQTVAPGNTVSRLADRHESLHLRVCIRFVSIAAGLFQWLSPAA
jgi:hypothetical protein